MEVSGDEQHNVSVSYLFVVWIGFELFNVSSYVSMLRLNEVFEQNVLVYTDQSIYVVECLVKDVANGVICFVGIESVLYRSV